MEKVINLNKLKNLVRPAKEPPTISAITGITLEDPPPFVWVADFTMTAQEATDIIYSFFGSLRFDFLKDLNEFIFSQNITYVRMHGDISIINREKIESSLVDNESFMDIATRIAKLCLFRWTDSNKSREVCINLELDKHKKSFAITVKMNNRVLRALRESKFPENVVKKMNSSEEILLRATNYLKKTMNELELDAQP